MHPGTFAGPLRFSKISRDETEVLTAFAFDETFRQEIPAFDCEFHLIQTALYGPLRFKMPPCSRFEIHAEGQSVFDRVKPEYNPEIMESIFTINKEPYGRIVKLHEFLENRSLRIAPLAPPDCDVVLCEKDYFSPYHKRIMLRNGTVYGAPLHLYSIRYTPSPQTASEEILQTISNELIDPEQSAWSEIRRRHEQALRMVAPEVTVEFLTGTGFIKVNGKYIASGIPAKLLRNILITSRKEKRFDFREQELFHLCHAEPGISEAGIMEYVQTIIRSLKETGSQLTLARSGKKKYVLKTTGQISYMEKPAA